MYHIPIPRSISYTKALIDIAYKNLDLYRLPKPRFISNTKNYIYITYQNLDLYLYDINLGFGKHYKYSFWYEI
jgi:hypothetical protein